jgi:DNA-binding GntR family transcriptional regulator
VLIFQSDASESASLADRAYHRIREMIVTLELPPGSVIDERELAERLGVGRTPIRQALRRLAGERLVDVYARRGTLVAPVNVRDLASLAELRRELESFAARLAAERLTAADRADLAGLRDELERAPADSERSLIELDQRIHRRVHEAAHNPFLESALDAIYVLSLRIWLLVLDRVQRLDDAVQEHRELLDAILAGDGERAHAVMRRHVTSFERAIREVL